jgi:rare lipoprotein A
LNAAPPASLLATSRAASLLRLPALLGLAALLALTAGCAHKHEAVAPPQPPSNVSWGETAGSNAGGSYGGARTVARGGHSLESWKDEYGRDLRPGVLWQQGTASFYGPQEQGRFTASGERFDYHKLTAAHRTLPLGTRVKVTDMVTHRSVVVRINDRGPFWPRRVIDLSVQAAKRIGMYSRGMDPVQIRIVSLPPLMPGRYTVQVGWFTSRRKFDRCRREMEKQTRYRVVDFASSDGKWLRYGRNASLDRVTAERIAHDLRRREFPAYIVRLN